jgi:hypothetical protein
MEAFLTVNMVMCMFLGVVWSRNTLLNLFVKFTFLGMTGWAAFLLLTSLGYIIKG